MACSSRNDELISLLEALRCPDCLGEEVGLHLGPEDAPLERTRVRCASCGRELDFSDGVLRALPGPLAGAAAENARFYDEMSADEESHLTKRSTTRNHVTKMGLVARHLALSDASPARKILELGFGTGAHAAAAIEAGHVYAGLDISAGLLAQTRRTTPCLEQGLLVHATGTRIPFRDDVFDAVFCVATLHHLEAPNMGIREMMRVLKRGGRFCFLEPRWMHPAHFAGYLMNPSVEVGSLRTSSRRFRRFLGELGVSECGVEYAVYTPNRPLGLIPAYDLIDRFCGRFAMLRFLSVVFCVHGTK